MVILGYATCTLLTNVFLQSHWYIAFLTNRENVQSLFLQRTCKLHSVWSVHRLLIFCTQISSPLFSSHHWRPFLTKRIPIPVFSACFWSVVLSRFPRRPLHLLLCFLSVLAFSVYSQSHKAVRISDSIWQPSPFIRQNSEKNAQSWR